MYYVIADLHGRYDLLDRSLAAIQELWTADDYIITLGDYIDRGQQSRQIIQRLMEEQEHLGDKFVCLLGNHEDLMLNAYLFPSEERKELWLINGGDATLKSYGAQRDGRYYQYDVNLVSKDHINWVKKLPIWLETPKHVFVHAGIPDDSPLDEQNEERLVWMLYAEDDHGWYQDKHVVHGHNIHEDGPLEFEGRTALDTGSFFTNRQVIGVFDDTQHKAKEFIEIK